jgi:hypothetical protein
LANFVRQYLRQEAHPALVQLMLGLNLEGRRPNDTNFLAVAFVLVILHFLKSDPTNTPTYLLSPFIVTELGTYPEVRTNKRVFFLVMALASHLGLAPLNSDWNGQSLKLKVADNLFDAKDNGCYPLCEAVGRIVLSRTEFECVETTKKAFPKLEHEVMLWFAHKEQVQIPLELNVETEWGKLTCLAPPTPVGKVCKLKGTVAVSPFMTPDQVRELVALKELDPFGLKPEPEKLVLGGCAAEHTGQRDGVLIGIKGVKEGVNGHPKTDPLPLDKRKRGGDQLVSPGDAALLNHTAIRHMFEYGVREIRFQDAFCLGETFPFQEGYHPGSQDQIDAERSEEHFKILWEQRNNPAYLKERLDFEEGRCVQMKALKMFYVPIFKTEMCVKFPAQPKGFEPVFDYDGAFELQTQIDMKGRKKV